MTDCQNDSHELNELIEAYLLLRDHGNAPSRGKFIEQHPEWANQLRDFFDAERRFKSVFGAKTSAARNIVEVPLERRQR